MAGLDLLKHCPFQTALISLTAFYRQVNDGATVLRETETVSVGDRGDVCFTRDKSGTDRVRACLESS